MFHVLKKLVNKIQYRTFYMKKEIVAMIQKRYMFIINTVMWQSKEKK